MINIGKEITQEALTELITKIIRDVNELTYDKFKSLTTGSFSSSDEVYSEIVNVGGSQVVLYSDSVVQEFLDTINELKSR